MNFIEINDELINLEKIDAVERYIDEEYENPKDFQYILIITYATHTKVYRVTSKESLDSLYKFIKDEIESINGKYVSRTTVVTKEEY